MTEKEQAVASDILTVLRDSLFNPEKDPRVYAEAYARLMEGCEAHARLRAEPMKSVGIPETKSRGEGLYELETLESYAYTDFFFRGFTKDSVSRLEFLARSLRDAARFESDVVYAGDESASATGVRLRVWRGVK